MRSRTLGTTDGPERSIAYLAAAAATLYLLAASYGATVASYTGEPALAVGVFVVAAAVTALYVDRTLAPGFWVAAPAAGAAIPATVAVAAGFLPATTWTVAVVSAAWAFSFGGAAAVAVERNVDLRQPAYGVGFVLAGTVVAYLLLATLGLFVAVFVGDHVALTVAVAVAATSSYVYGHLTDTSGELLIAPAAAVAVVCIVAALQGAVAADIATALAVVNTGFAAGALPLANLEIYRKNLAGM